MRMGALLDLILTNKEGLTADVKVKGNFGFSDCEMMVFRILIGGSGAKSKITVLVFRSACFGLQRSAWLDQVTSRGPFPRQPFCDSSFEF